MAKNVDRVIRECVSAFHEKRIDKLNKLDLKKVLKRKNPYLFRVTGVKTARELVGQLLYAYVSASEEGIFANEFVEPVFQAVVPGAKPAGVKGVDFVRHKGNVVEAIALKSGPNIFNSGQISKQSQQFNEMRRSLAQTNRGQRKNLVPILGCCYGQCDMQPTATQAYAKLAGQAFWKHFTRDPEFHLKLLRLMGNPSARQRHEYSEAWKRAVARFEKEFSADFCDANGNIRWARLVEFNSGERGR